MCMMKNVQTVLLRRTMIGALTLYSYLQFSTLP